MKGQDVDLSSEKVGSLSNGDSIQEDSLFTAAEERRFKWKTDLVILPLMCGVFFLQYLDKQSLSYASVFGLITDLKLVGTQYSWCSSIFYIGMTPPGNLLWIRTDQSFRSTRCRVPIYLPHEQAPPCQIRRRHNVRLLKLPSCQNPNSCQCHLGHRMHVSRSTQKLSQLCNSSLPPRILRRRRIPSFRNYA